MPSGKRWEVKAPDGTVVARYKRFRDIPSDILERGWKLERRVVFFAVRRPDSAKGDK